jgi:hypothetical protein
VAEGTEEKEQKATEAASSGGKRGSKQPPKEQQQVTDPPENADGNDGNGGDQDEAETVHIDRLIADAYDYFGEPGYVVAGALSDAGGNKKNFTVEEAKGHVTDFLKRKVEEE